MLFRPAKERPENKECVVCLSRCAVVDPPPEEESSPTAYRFNQSLNFRLRYFPN
jgi:hypothetical protein